ncbi:MAG: hypothetical protein IJS62_07875, partial [Bacteroidales bacterium]|nr:hypothetical protein [Bacteroidales bacterium]
SWAPPVHEPRATTPPEPIAAACGRKGSDRYSPSRLSLPLRGPLPFTSHGRLRRPNPSGPPAGRRSGASPAPAPSVALSLPQAVRAGNLPENGSKHRGVAGPLD